MSEGTVTRIDPGIIARPVEVTASVVGHWITLRAAATVAALFAVVLDLEPGF
jgi:hypothetical protein